MWASLAAGAMKAATGGPSSASAKQSGSSINVGGLTVGGGDSNLYLMLGVLGLVLILGVVMLKKN